jgi:uncharacterized membrane protein
LPFFFSGALPRPFPDFFPKCLLGKRGISLGAGFGAFCFDMILFYLFDWFHFFF